MTFAPDTEALNTLLVKRSKPRPLIVGLLKNPLGAVAVIYLAVVIVVGLLSPLIAPFSPNFTDLSKTDAPWFTPGYLLGGDASGRDILSRLLYSTREAIVACLLVLVVSLTLGVVSGLIAGYYRGTAERIIEFVSDSIMTLPGIVLLIALYARTGPNMVVAMSVFGVLIAPSFFRLVRASVLAVRSELYVDAAKVVGLSDLRIVGRHVLWAVRGPVVIHSSFVLSAGIAIQAGINFLGLGDARVPSWGGMLQESFKYIYRNPAGIVWPAVLISVTILALVLLGNAARDVLQATGSAHALSGSRRRALQRAHTAPEVRTQPDPDVVLEIRDLRMGYANSVDAVNEVLHGVDFDLRRGEIHGLVGESGSGKSQVAFSILGILPKEAIMLGGSVIVDGSDVLNDRAALRSHRGRKIGYIPQEPMSNLDPSFTIGDQLIFGLRAVRPISKAEARERISTLLTRIGIVDAPKVMRMYPHEISGGMAQRVLICGAVAAEPDIIIADEPTTALDVTVQAEVLELLRELSAERGLAMILVTHNLGVVADLCSTVSVMRAGSIVERGNVADIFDAPQHAYTRELLASSRSVEILEVEL